MKEIKLSTDYTELINLLTDDEAGILFKTIMQYASIGMENEIIVTVDNDMTVATRILFEVIRRDIDAQEEG